MLTILSRCAILDAEMFRALAVLSQVIGLIGVNYYFPSATIKIPDHSHFF